MSSASQSRIANRRISSMQGADRIERRASRARPRQVEFLDVYTHTLGAAYLHHLLQPRAKRKQYVTPVAKTHKRSATVSSLDRFVGEKITEFTGLHKTKSKTTLPHNFMDLSSKRMMLVIQGKEYSQAYRDRVVRMVFAEAYNAMSEEAFAKRMSKDRRVEDLILIFYGKAVSALQKEGDPEDTSYSMRAVQYLALFVRLIISILRDERKDKDRPELMSRLVQLEKDLLTGSEDLSSGIGEGGNKGSNTVEVEVPLSHDVKDMNMVQIVAHIFGKSLSEVQVDLNAKKKLWTEDAALEDLKSYSHCLTTGTTTRTLRSEDFDLEEAYQAWKKVESPEVTQLMADIIRTKSKATKYTTDKPLPAVSPTSANWNDRTVADLSKSVSSPISELSNSISSPNDLSLPMGLDQPFDMSSLSIKDDQPSRLYLEESTFTFIPPDPRAFYRTVMLHAMLYDRMHSTEAGDPPLSRQSLELLIELAMRWRVPHFSRFVLFTDVVSERFKDEDFTLDDLDAAFKFAETMLLDTKKHGSKPYFFGPASKVQNQWTINDFALYCQSLSNLYDDLLRELCALLRLGYEPKLPKGWNPGGILQILEDYITSDPSFSKSQEDLERKTNELAEGLTEQAQHIYVNCCLTGLPESKHEWQFYHVIQLGQLVVKLYEKVQKRYKNNPKVMGITPVTILVETLFPAFEKDAFQLIQDIKDEAAANGEDISMDDGFALYRELVKIRSIHLELLPTSFAFKIEETLAEFVWRYTQTADESIPKMIVNAVAQDKFQVRSIHPDPDEPGWEPPSDDERHSVSVIDIFIFFNSAVNEIHGLEWHEHDDIGYAKFMTALSKSFVTGLARYCEVIEQKFKREMDRPSPAQEAAAMQSKQERWLQLAKDTWNNKERIEPFQFYPESLVKLNNVEYAIQQLDKLEQHINVEACAEVLRRVEERTPQRKQRRINKYVFTVKIVEAEDLPATDANGLSDPYVILGDEKQRRLHKTRVVNKSLNPRWDESVDVNVTGPTNIVATVWDNDLIGEDDFVGRTSLKLDPVHFNDYLPREYWLDLDTRGRLLVRVSMEGERDDIEFYFAKAFRLLKRTERDMTRTITAKLSQYINSCLSKDTINRLLSKPLSIASVTNIWKKQPVATPTPTQVEMRAALEPLCDYFNENFAVMKNTLTDQSMIMVMARVWKEVLMTIDALLLPPLAEKLSAQRPLNDTEFNVVVCWLEHMLHFFEAKDERGVVQGVPTEILKSPKYSEIATVCYFYFETTDNLIRQSASMASTTAQQVREMKKRFTAPASLGPPSSGAALSGASVRRAKSIMTSRNLGTMRKAKAERWKQQQEQPNDDMLLRILRMRPEAEAYLRERSRQKERLAATAAADQIVLQSLASGGGARLGANGSPRR